MSQLSKCPVCHSSKFHSTLYAEEYGRVVECHEYCPRCGYCCEQAYSPSVSGFTLPIKRGHKCKLDGKYYPKDYRKLKRIRRKHNVKIREPFRDRFFLTFLI